MTLAPSPSPLLMRGIFRAPWLSADNRAVFFAIDGDHRLLFTRELGPEDDAKAITGEMWRELDKADPEHSRRAKS